MPMDESRNGRSDSLQTIHLQCQQLPLKLVGMNPKVFIVPIAILMSGLLCLALLPVSLSIRLAVFGADLAAAALVGFVLWRQNS